MVSTKSSKIWRFLNELHLGLAGLEDTKRDDLESYAEAVGHTIRKEPWLKMDKKLNSNANEGQNKTTRFNRS